MTETDPEKVAREAIERSRALGCCCDVVMRVVVIGFTPWGPIFQPLAEHDPWCPLLRAYEGPVRIDAVPREGT